MYAFISPGNAFQASVIMSGDTVIQPSKAVPNAVKRSDHMRQKLRHWGIGEILIIVLERLRFLLEASAAQQPIELPLLEVHTKPSKNPVITKLEWRLLL